MRKFRRLAFFLFAGATSALADEVVVASYNLENYLGQEQAAPQKGRPQPKSEAAIAAEVGIIHEIGPDILGVCEMGRPAQFKDFQSRLKAAGLDYPATEYLEAADPDRHLALLSRFPIVSRQSQPNVTFDFGGIPMKVIRGFLDVTVRVNDQYDLRLIGVHLKSKLPVPEGEALLRRHEAQLLRRHVERILTTEPGVNLLVYGDFNAARNEAAILEVEGARGSGTYMAPLPAADRTGERWTHYWKEADVYSRLDYLFVSPSLLHAVVPGKTLINRSDQWFQASDHRAVYTSIVSGHSRH